MISFTSCHRFVSLDLPILFQFMLKVVPLRSFFPFLQSLFFPYHPLWFFSCLKPSPCLPLSYMQIPNCFCILDVKIFPAFHAITFPSSLSQQASPWGSVLCSDLSGREGLHARAASAQFFCLLALRRGLFILSILTCKSILGYTERWVF